MSEEMRPVLQDEMITFDCCPDVPCFNECCRDLNQSLTPYDILRLKNNLGISSGDFLRTYTSLHIGPESGLPVVTFKPNPDTGNACPFVKPDGCSVYEDRPASCRMYPLARAISKSRETGKITEYYALIKEPHCRGFEQKKAMRVSEWLANQNVARYNRWNDRLMEIISLKNQRMPGRLDGAMVDKFTMACYDLDAFRSAVFHEGLFEGLRIPSSVLESARSDDRALLDLGLSWIVWEMFGIEMDFGAEQ